MRIGASITSAEQSLLNALADANAAAALHALRLASGAKISQPSQDPAAFVHIASLQTRLSHVDSTLTNVESASNVVAQVQLALDGIRTQLETIRSALEEDEDLQLTAQQRLEKQADIDDALSKIDRLATSEMEGRQRLDGSTNYRSEGLNPNQVRQLQVFAIRETGLRGTVTTRAQRASLTYTGAAGEISANAVFTLTGDRGSTSSRAIDPRSISRITSAPVDSTLVSEARSYTVSSRTAGAPAS
jgi:flagellin-like hook-associated protein FlgL